MPETEMQSTHHDDAVPPAPEEEETVGLVSGLQQSNRRLRRTLFGILAVAVVAAAAVGVYYGAFYRPSGLAVSEETDTSFSAEFTHGDETIELRLQNTPVGEPDALLFALHFNGRGSVDYDVDFGAMHMVIDGHGIVLTAAEKEALVALQEELVARLVSAHGSQQGHLNVGMLERTSSYLSQAPNGFAIGRREFDLAAHHAGAGDGAEASDEPSTEPAGKRSVRTAAWEQDEGTTCLRWGGVYQARFDGADGSNWGWWHVVGTDSVCTGRCGAGCNWFDREAFKDCMDHDLCVTHFGGSVLSGNSDCGDEFWAAADDYVVSYGWFC